jgi:SAM-dependent methyltransferase
MSSVETYAGRTWRPDELASLASSIYQGVSPVRRRIMSWRPYICPFDRLVEYVPEVCSILDLGCGAGLFLGLLAATGRRIRGVGFDTSTGAIDAARHMAIRVRSLGFEADLRFEHLDLRAPWSEGAFDVVSMIDVMHHVPLAHRRSALERASAAVRAGGLLLYKDIGDRPQWRATANRVHDLLMSHEWVRYTPCSEVETWAASGGLELLVSERINYLWYGHDLRLFRKI